MSRLSHSYKFYAISYFSLSRLCRAHSESFEEEEAKTFGKKLFWAWNVNKQLDLSTFHWSTETTYQILQSFENFVHCRTIKLFMNIDYLSEQQAQGECIKACLWQLQSSHFNFRTWWNLLAVISVCSLWAADNFQAEKTQNNGSDKGLHFVCKKAFVFLTVICCDFKTGTD